MKKLKVNPGICGLESLICVEADRRGNATITVETKCPAVKKMIDSMNMPINGYEVIRSKPGKNAVYDAAENLAHAACPVPSALLKCIEVECKLALPRTVQFEFIEE